MDCRIIQEVVSYLRKNHNNIDHDYKKRSNKAKAKKEKVVNKATKKK